MGHDLSDAPIRSCAVVVAVVRFFGSALREGIEVHPDKGVAVRVYSVEKTIADCFKYRHKIGSAVAVNALRTALEQNRCDLQRLEAFAAVCRVAPVVKPFLRAAEVIVQRGGGCWRRKDAEADRY